MAYMLTHFTLLLKSFRALQPFYKFLLIIMLYKDIDVKKKLILLYIFMVLKID